MQGIREYLSKSKLIADGAFGTYYAEKYKTGGSIPEAANLEHPEFVKEIHLEYIQAGARLIRTNTFAANQKSLKTYAKQWKEMIKAGYQIAKEAAAESGEEVYIAADIGPIPVSAFEEETDLFQEYQEIVDTFLECSADLFLFETFSDPALLKELSEYIKKANPDAFIVTQFSLNRYGYTKSGISASRLLAVLADCTAVDAAGFNCGIGSGHLYQILQKMKPVTRQFITAMPNAGYPEILQDRMVYLNNKSYFAEKLEKISKLGVSILGGCCGTTPDFIKEADQKISKAQNRMEISVSGPVTENEKVPECENPFCQKLFSGQKVLAVELDPPYDAKIDKIMECANLLKAEQADLLTFADSPMGRGRVDSVLMSSKVLLETGMPVMPHLTCRDRNAISIRAGLLGAYIHQIRNFLIVTGDPVPGEQRNEITGVFDFNSIRLMEYIKEMNREHFLEDPVYYGGALNYARANIDVEIERMKKKQDAGAAYFLTQPIYTKADMEKISYIKTKIQTKILCGIMPLISLKNASFIKNEIAGIHVPESIVARYEKNMTREEGEAVGVAIACEIMKELADIADGYYMMLPFNRVHLISEIKKQINLQKL